MPLALAESAIRTRLTNRWVDNSGQPLSPIIWENIVNNLTELAIRTSWISCEVVFKKTSQIGFSSNFKILIRSWGEIRLSSFVSQGVGTNTALVIAERAAKIFRFASFDNILCGAPDIHPSTTTGSWFKVTITVPFHLDELA